MGFCRTNPSQVLGSHVTVHLDAGYKPTEPWQRGSDKYQCISLKSFLEVVIADTQKVGRGTLTRHHLTPASRIHRKDRKRSDEPCNILRLRWRSHTFFHRVFGLKTLEESIAWFYELATGNPFPTEEVSDIELIRELKPLVYTEGIPDLGIFHARQRTAYKRLFGTRGFAHVACTLVKIRRCKKRAAQWFCEPLPIICGPPSSAKEKERIAAKKRRDRRMVRNHLRQLTGVTACRA